MELTLKKEVNLTSIALQHDILVEATSLLVGREGVLETEKILYLMVATIDNLVDEELITICNDDPRDLMTIIKQDLEPEFNKLKEMAGFEEMWNNLVRILLARCDQIWKEQNSVMGVIEGIIDMIATMPDNEKKEALIATGKIAEQAFDRRTEKMEKAANETNDKLEQLVQKYEKIGQELAEKKEEEKVEESDAE